MRETTPAVFMIAEPHVNWEAVGRYLDTIGGTHWVDRVAPPTVSDHSAACDRVAFAERSGSNDCTCMRGVSRRPASGTDAEMLIEFAGRGCYRSWAPGLNANVTAVREDSGAYLRNILSSGHGSVLEHAQFTFVFHDVSRVFTHELVRHRVGTAISQESLRYVRLADLGVRIPDVLNRDDVLLPDRTEEPYDSDGVTVQPLVMLPKAIVSLVETLEEFQRDAAEALGLDSEHVPFSVKKEATSALRRLAPIGLSTMMTWSANVRTLRHVIVMRTSKHAEEEIRLVFQEVARQLSYAHPLLFGDLTPNEDGEWTSPHPV